MEKVVQMRVAGMTFCLMKASPIKSNVGCYRLRRGYEGFFDHKDAKQSKLDRSKEGVSSICALKY
jgi:hypothetical protein